MNRLDTTLRNLTEKEINNIRNNVHTFSNRLKGTYNIVLERIKNIKSKEVKNFVERIPRYYTRPKKILKNHRNTRIFQPIEPKQGEYWEITNRKMNGRIITGYRRVNIYSGESNKWQYKIAA